MNPYSSPTSTEGTETAKSRAKLAVRAILYSHLAAILLSALFTAQDLRWIPSHGLLGWMLLGPPALFAIFACPLAMAALWFYRPQAVGPRGGMFLLECGLSAFQMWVLSPAVQ